jgi:hypothetical protein
VLDKIMFPEWTGKHPRARFTLTQPCDFWRWHDIVPVCFVAFVLITTPLLRREMVVLTRDGGLVRVNRCTIMSRSAVVTATDDKPRGLEKFHIRRRRPTGDPLSKFQEKAAENLIDDW